MTVPLHAHSYFSLLRGVGSPDSLAARAAELGYPALALTDRDALYGAASFQLACRELGLKPLFGAELTLDDGSQITLLAMNQTGYGNLCRLVSYARLGRPKGEAWLPSEKLSEQSTGLICLSGPSLSSTIPHLIRANRKREAVRLAAHYRDLFGDRFYLEAQHHALPGDDRLIADLAALGSRLGIPLVATADVHYPRPEDRPLQDIVTCIRTKTTLATPSTERLPNGQFFLQSPDVFAEPFRRYPEALEQTAAIAARCDVELDFHDARFPSTPLPAGHTADDELRRLSREGAARRYGNPSSRVCRQLDHELGVIAMRGLAPFFLIAADIAERFRGRCRGSAAGSLVSYCLGMSAVDPLAYNMLFERFINPERDSPPDIDIDFSQDDREEAIAYCYRTYGYERAGMVANYVRFRGRSAVRDVGKVLGMPADLIDRIARTLDHFASGDQLTIAIEDLTAQEPGANQPWPLLARFCRELDDTPRHLSVHVGGMLLTGRPLIELLGLEQARKEGVVVVGADKEDVEDLGLGKLDLLCLRALSVVQESEELERGRGVPLDVASLNLDDPAVYEALGQADTIGASQVESRAQQQSLVRTRPRNFTDLMAQVAIIRPGPIQGGAVHPYYRRRAGLEPVTYLHPALAPILEPTLGIFLYQEQVLLGVSALTGCSAGEADGFRRAMGSHRSHEAMTRLRPWFIEHAIEHGVVPDVAASAFEQIAGFADYGFCQSHAGSLARLAYETMYIKLHHPAAFTASLLSNQPMGFYPVEVLVWEARRRGVRFLPVDINRSEARCTLEDARVRLGLEQVRAVGPERAEEIVSERRAHGPYRSLRDFVGRTGFVGKLAEGLILAGAFDHEHRAHPELLWELYRQRPDRRQRDLGLVEPETAITWPERTEAEQTALDYLILGFSLERHLIEHYRSRLAALGVVPSTRLPKLRDGQVTRIGGMVICRQKPPTAKGYLFLTLEDEHGLMNVIVRPDVYEKYRDILRQNPLLAIAGRLQHAYGTLNILAERVLGLDLSVPDAPPQAEPRPLAAAARSHDFR